MPKCEHTSLVQISEMIVRWSWERKEDGTYEPDETYDKVLSEDTIEFKCNECEEIVSLDDDAKIEEDE